MRTALRQVILTLAAPAILPASGVFAQNLKLKNAKSWELTGRVQMQHLINTDINGQAAKTNNGFRMRRVRLQIKTKLSDFVETKFQIEARDNSPRLKDAEGKFKLSTGFHLRFGQFKVPVWREELRSSGKLLLVERSPVAEFLADHKLSARHIGVEFGRTAKDGVSFALNYSNGAGEGGREDAGRTKSDFTNNGKLFSGRLNVPVGQSVQIGVSAAANQVGNTIAATDNKGSIAMLAPDIGLYFGSQEKGRVEIEGGAVFGSISADFLGAADRENFTLFDVSGKFVKALREPNRGLAGLDAIEIAAGFSLINEMTDLTVFRFGPAATFGKQTRLQVNAEIENPDGGDAILQIRSQLTINF